MVHMDDDRAYLYSWQQTSLLGLHGYKTTWHALEYLPVPFL